MQVMYAAEGGWPRVYLAAWGLRVQEFQDQPQGAHQQPSYQAPEGPLGRGETNEELKLAGLPLRDPHRICLCHPPVHWPSSRRCPG